MFKPEERLPIFFLISFLILSFPPPTLWAQASVSVQLSETEVKANDTVELTFSLDQEEDFYYFSAEVLFDDTIFEFVNVENTGLTSGGLSVADVIEPGRLGASVTLTEELQAADQGAFMKVIFSVQSKASVGTDSFVFEQQELSDSSGETIETIPVEEADYTINESIGEAELTINQTVTVTEGDEFNATGRIYAADDTDDPINENRFRTWIGVSDQDTDPTTWSEANWFLMDFVEKDGENYFTYTEEIAFMRPVGTWYVALRSDLDQDEDYRFGGIEGLWNDDSAVMTIEETPPFQYNVAEWDFDDETITVSQSVPANEEAEIGISGAAINGYSAGATGQAKNSKGWDGYPDQENYWQVVISTKNFEELTISSKQYGSGTGPRDFQLQTSVDGTVWNDVSGGEITVEDNWTSGVISNQKLPVELNNLDEAYIRWVQTSDFTVDGNEGVNSGGTSRIDDILITGTNTNVETAEVWPGDTNNDGIVDEEDLLPVGQYWLKEGPEPIYNSKAWEARDVEGWIPQKATHADANGSGRVDQNDLQPIGLNFGQTRVTEKSTEDQFDVLARYEVSPLEMGETIDLYLHSPEKIGISGISVRLQIAGVDPEAWSIDSVDPLEWGEEWIETNRMLHFETRNNKYHAAAMAHKGAVESVTSDQLLRITVRADESWPQSATAELLRAIVSSGTNTYSLTDVYLTNDPDAEPEVSEPEKPSRTELLNNYPNPFNPTTVIPFTLSEAGDVRVDVYDAIGRRVASVFREAQQPGEYSVDFDGASLSSGVYIYRLQVNNVQQTRMMTLIK